MEDGEVAFEFVNEVKLHFGQLGIIRGEGLDAIFVAYSAAMSKTRYGSMTQAKCITEEHASLGDDASDRHGSLLCLCGDIAAGGDDDEGVCLAVRVLDVEPTEEDGCSGDDPLPEEELLAELGYDWEAASGVSVDNTDGRGGRGHSEGDSRFAKNMLRKPRCSGLSTYWRS